MEPQPFTPTLAPPLPAHVVFVELTEDEETEPDTEDESDEPDPTIGRYEGLEVAVLDPDSVGAQRVAAEAVALSGPHRVFPHDPAGPGSLAETLARLEGEGRLTSRVCDDDESGFYVLYEPVREA